MTRIPIFYANSVEQNFKPGKCCTGTICNSGWWKHNQLTHQFPKKNQLTHQFIQRQTIETTHHSIESFHAPLSSLSLSVDYSCWYPTHCIYAIQHLPVLFFNSKQNIRKKHVLRMSITHLYGGSHYPTTMVIIKLCVL